jgi:hypothetical protein
MMKVDTAKQLKLLPVNIQYKEPIMARRDECKFFIPRRAARQCDIDPPVDRCYHIRALEGCDRSLLTEAYLDKYTDTVECWERNECGPDCPNWGEK